MKCDDCGFSNAADVRFCGGCGTPLAPPAPSFMPDAERRHMCVLFCDLVGSTQLSQKLDPEDLRDLVDSYQRACGEIVERHEGYVAQYLGDGMLVYFGYPQAHEDDSFRVVRCGLDIVERAGELASEGDVALQVRIGIHSGRVVIGSLGGSARSERLAIGDTPNIAARVQGEAEPGQVIVTEAVCRLLPSSIQTEPVGARALKGVREPMTLYRVVSAARPASGLEPYRVPFVGRQGNRQLLRQLWSDVSDGHARFALIRGEPGIGKSRLVSVAKSDLANPDTPVLVARCTPFTTASALRPIVELLQRRLGLDGTSDEGRVAHLVERLSGLAAPTEESVPLLASLLGVPLDPEQWPAPELSPVRARQRTMDLLIELLRSWARLTPMLLVVEDLHWADPSTLDFLRQLVTSSSRRLLAVFTARPEFEATWEDAPRVTAIELDALGHEEAEALVRKVARNKPPPPKVVWQICERAAGNPLFLEEITQAVIESGALIEGTRSWELAAQVEQIDTDVVPTSMEASLLSRLDHLGNARGSLQLAATLGREFSLEVLLAVSGLAEGQVLQHLDAMLASGLIYSHGDSTAIYTFKHALVRDAAYAQLLRTTRKQYHARIAEVLLDRFPEVAREHPEILAHHQSGAGRHGEAAEQWQLAGERAARRSAVPEAMAHLRRALADLAELPEDDSRMDRELSVLSVLAPVLMAVHGWAAPEVGEACARAIELALKLEAHARMYPPMWGLWTNQFVGGRLHEAMETAEKVLAMALAAGEPMLEITGRHATSYTHYYRAEFDAAIQEANAAFERYSFELELTLAQQFQLSSTVNLQASRGSSLWMQGHQDAGIRQMDEMIELARSLRHPPSVAGALAFAMFFTLYDRDYARMLEITEELYDLSRAEGFAMWTANAGMHRGRARMELGDRQAGIAEVLEWGALFRQTGSGIIEGNATSMMSDAMHRNGDAEQALVVNAEGAARAEANMVRVMLPEIYRKRGNILRDLGRYDAARAAYEKAVERAREQQARSLELRALTSLVELQVDRGPVDELRRQLSAALDAMSTDPARPDLMAARALLTRVA